MIGRVGFKKIDKLVLTSFLGPFILTFLIITFILVLQFLWIYIDELVGKGLSFAIILEFLGWGSATLVTLALPLATLLASIMTFGNLGENNELLAMKAAGISLKRILAPAFVLSVAISIGAFFAANDLIPLAYNKIYTLRDDISRTKEEIKIPTGIFYNGIDGYTIRIGRQKGETMYDIMLYDHTKNIGNTNLTIADSGKIRVTEDKRNLIFTLYHGTMYEESIPESPMDSTYKMQKINFSMNEALVSMDNYAFQRSETGRFSNEVMSKNLKELREMRDSLDTTYVKIKANQVQNLLISGGASLARQLDTTHAAFYKGEVDPDSLIWKSLEQKVDGYSSAVAQIGTAISILTNAQIDEVQYSRPLRKIDIESLRKFTTAVACILFFFIGAPLGSIIRKGGLGTPAVISILFFVIYWVIDISGKKLATDGTISPTLGALVSSMVLLPIGIFLTRKSIQDSTLFNLETYKLFIKKLLNSTYKIKTIIRKK